MNPRLKALLVLIAVVCFGIALSYPITYYREAHQADEGMARLTALRDAGRQAAARTAEPAREATGEAAVAPATSDGEAPEMVPADDAGATAMPSPTTGAGGQAAERTVEPTATAAATSAPSDDARQAAERTAEPTAAAATGAPTVAPTPTPSPTPVPTPTPDRRLRSSALSYPEKEKVTLREEDILPEYRELYEINHDLVGWITIARTPIDYPVLQSEDREYYLKHDFFGSKNNNGQIILDTSCDPYTPSYNLVISGHNLYNDTMFSTLVKYRRRDYWEAHKIVRCDVLTEEREYVAFAAFFSADYDEDEEGFRYNADIQYRVDAERWLSEIRENQIYDTGIDAAFGDEFLTLTTCNHTYRKNGRFVLVCRRLREGEMF